MSCFFEIVLPVVIVLFGLLALVQLLLYLAGLGLLVAYLIKNRGDL